MHEKGEVVYVLKNLCMKKRRQPRPPYSMLSFSTSMFLFSVAINEKDATMLLAWDVLARNISGLQCL